MKIYGGKYDMKERENILYEEYVSPNSPLSYLEWLEEQVLSLRGIPSKREETVLEHDFKENDVVVSMIYKKMYRVIKVFPSHLSLEDENGTVYGYSNYSDLRRVSEEEAIEFLKKRLIKAIKDSPVIPFSTFLEIEKIMTGK